MDPATGFELPSQDISDSWLSKPPPSYNPKDAQYTSLGSYFAYSFPSRRTEEERRRRIYILYRKGEDGQITHRYDIVSMWKKLLLRCCLADLTVQIFRERMSDDYPDCDMQHLILICQRDYAKWRPILVLTIAKIETTGHMPNEWSEIHKQAPSTAAISLSSSFSLCRDVRCVSSMYDLHRQCPRRKVFGFTPLAFYRNDGGELKDLVQP